MEKQYENENVQVDQTAENEKSFWHFCLGVAFCYLSAYGFYELGMFWLMILLLWMPLFWLVLFAVDISIDRNVKLLECHLNGNMNKTLFAVATVVVTVVMLAGTVCFWQDFMAGSHILKAVLFVLSYMFAMFFAFFSLIFLVILRIFPGILGYFGL